jgi:hypothetical protein
MYPLAGHDFVDWDDPHNLRDNPRYNPPTLSGLAHYWAEPEGGLYVPLAYTAWYALALVARHTGAGDGLDPRVFHLANLVVHVACAWAVYALLHALLRTDPGAHPTRVATAAALGALLFALHPVQVETVAWVSGLKDLLCGLFATLCLWFFVTHARVAPDEPRAAARRQRLYLLATASFAAALLSKPVAAVLPAVALVIDLVLLRRPPGRALAMLVPWAILALPILLITRNAQPIPVVYEITPWRVRPAVAGDALAFYLRQIALPAHLALDYGRSPDVIGASRWALLAWIVPIAVIGALWLVRRRASAVAVGGAIFFIALAPVLGFRPFGAQVYSSVTDHYLYLPMIGVALAAAWAGARVPVKVACAVALPVLVALAVKSWHQTWTWQNSTTLFTHNLRVNPRSWTSHVNLAADALLRGDYALAERHSREGAAIRPTDGLIHMNLGVALLLQNRFDEAAGSLQTAVKLAPYDPSARVWLARAFFHLGRTDDAAEQYRAALRLDPQRSDAKAMLERLGRRVNDRGSRRSRSAPRTPPPPRTSAGGPGASGR